MWESWTIKKTEIESRSVMSNSLWLLQLYSPWNSPGQNTGVGSLSFLQGIFTIQGWNPGLLHWRMILYQLSHQGYPKKAECLKNWWFQIGCWRILFKLPWTARRSNQSILKEINLMFTGRTDAKAEIPILWPLDVKNWLSGKGPNAGKDWGQEKGITEEMVV